MSKVVGSHIQIPKLILKNFENEKKDLFYYEFNNCKIKRGHAKSLYRQEGYYSKVVEEYLGRKIESRLGELAKFVKNTSFQVNDNPPKEYEDIAFTYLYSLLSRAPSLLKQINEESSFWWLLSETDQHDIAAHDGLIMAKEKHFLKGNKVAFLNNTTDEELVLPTGGVVQYNGYLICPICPKRAIVFDNRQDTGLCDGEISLFEIESEEEITKINMQAFLQEKEGDARYVVATNREILKRILSKIKEKDLL